MSEFTTIKNNDDLQKFFSEVGYLHDSMIRQCTIQSIGYVDDDFLMYGDAEPFNVKIFIQSQFSESPCIEIHLFRVYKLLIKDVSISDSCGKIEGQKIIMSFSCSDEEQLIHRNDYDVIAEEMKYRILDKSFLGKKLML